jgi:RecA/RadA recombinase
MLMGLFRKEAAKEALGRETRHPTYATGFHGMDYRNGYIDDQGYVQAGLDGGRILTLVGNSGTGKSTFGMQIAANMVKPFENGIILHYDFERATNKERFRKISGWSKAEVEAKYQHLNTEIYAETVFSAIRKTADLKLANFDKLKVAIKWDESGKEIEWGLPPTVIFVDSLALMMPKKITEEEELSGSMSASAVAKVNTAVLKRCMSPLQDGNIFLIIINHINKKIEINPMIKTQADVNYLKQDESLPGGKAAVYLANYLIKLVASKKLKKEEELGVDGFLVTGELIKSRSNAAGKTFVLVFDQANGMNADLSAYVALKDAKKIGGAGRSWYLENMPEVKFAQKDFLEKLNSVPGMRDKFDELCFNHFSDMIPAEDDYEDQPDLSSLQEHFEEGDDGEIPDA